MRALLSLVDTAADTAADKAQPLAGRQAANPWQDGICNLLVDV